MLLSRFWYIFLAVLAAAAASAALLSLGVINRQAVEHVGDELRRDRTELDAILRLEARARLDRIAFISVDSKLGGLLKQASGIADRAQLARVGSETKDTLNGHVARLLEATQSDAKTKEADLKPDIAIAVDATGRIIAQLGSLESNPPGSSLATYPFIERALHGYVRDDVIVYDRRVYRIAARPVLYGGEYVGAIAHGYKFDDDFAARVSQGLGGATVAFFYGRNTLASAAAGTGPALAEVTSGLPEVLNDERFKRGERTEPLALKGAGGRAIYSLMIGSGAQSEVGYTIARPLTVIASPLAFFQGASREDVEALPLPYIGGAAFVLALLGLLFVYFERDRPQKALRRNLRAIVDGERERLLITEWRGADRKLADAVNEALDKTTERAAEMAPTAKKKANLDEILGPTPESNVEPYFGFADAAPAAPAKPKTPARPEPAAVKEPAAPAATTDGAGRKAAVVAPAPAPAAAGNKLPKPPAPAAAAAPVKAPAAAAPAAAAPIPFQSTNDNAGDLPDEASHFREVYAQYLSVRRDCGESTDGLSYEKFETTLTKTRDQVLSKHPAKTVRFTVYVKEGKAALKAAPVKR
ncbi:MAG: MXAN_5187 family protein [Polyangiales bacterium]